MIANEVLLIATDNAGNRNNILAVPHSKEQETKVEPEPEVEKEEKQEDAIEKPAESSTTSSSYLPLIHESDLNPVVPTPKSEAKDESNSASHTQYIRQLDGSVDGGQHAREALPAEIENLTPTTAPLFKKTHQKEPSPEPEVSTEKESKTEDNSPEATTKPLTIESVKESALEIKDEWFGQKDSTEDAQSVKRGSGNIGSRQTKDEEKRNSSHSSESSDPVNQSDHTDDSFVLVPQHENSEYGEDAGAIGSSTKSSEDKDGNQFEPAKPNEPQTSEVKENEVTANRFEMNPSQAGQVTTGSIPTDDDNTAHQSIESSQNFTSEKANDQTPKDPDSSDTTRLVVGLQQSFDGTAPPAAPLPVTPYVVGNRQLGDDGGPTREILNSDEGPSITVQPATPGPANLSGIEPSKQLGDVSSSAVDDSSTTQITKRSKQGTPISGRAASPSSMRTIPRDVKPNKGLLKTFLHLVFVEWIGKFFGKLWSGFKRQPRNE